MRGLILIIKAILSISERITGVLFRVDQLLTHILPAVLSPEQLIRLIRNHYDDSYKGLAARLPEACYKWTLERSW
ncbi:MAG TPA: hypothetical protein VJU02_08100 [Nitrospiraceae bacterium]|nr:hypothetical protein [Nitrospiraceae bacterium]